MRNLNYSILNVCRTNRHGSRSTQVARHRTLNQIADQLHDMGFKRIGNINGLKEKHVYTIVNHWKDSGITDATVKNRMTHIRWLAGISSLPIARHSNSSYGIGSRENRKTKSLLMNFDQSRVGSITDTRVRLTLQLQIEFGLRREEAIKLIPSLADKGTYLALRDFSQKDKKTRVVPIETYAQRKVLDASKELAPRYSMIDPARSYKRQLAIHEKETQAAGVGHTHAGRVHYSLSRYKRLTGWHVYSLGADVERTEGRQVCHEKALQTIAAELGVKERTVLGYFQ